MEGNLKTQAFNSMTWKVVFKVLAIPNKTSEQLNWLFIYLNLTCLPVIIKFDVLYNCVKRLGGNNVKITKKISCATA